MFEEKKKFKGFSQGKKGDFIHFQLLENGKQKDNMEMMVKPKMDDLELELITRFSQILQSIQGSDYQSQENQYYKQIYLNEIEKILTKCQNKLELQAKVQQLYKIQKLLNVCCLRVKKPVLKEVVDWLNSLLEEVNFIPEENDGNLEDLTDYWDIIFDFAIRGQFSKVINIIKQHSFLKNVFPAEDDEIYELIIILKKYQEFFEVDIEETFKINESLESEFSKLQEDLTEFDKKIHNRQKQFSETDKKKVDQYGYFRQLNKLLLGNKEILDQITDNWIYRLCATLQFQHGCINYAKLQQIYQEIVQLESQNKIDPLSKFEWISLELICLPTQWNKQPIAHKAVQNMLSIFPKWFIFHTIDSLYRYKKLPQKIVPNFGGMYYNVKYLQEFISESVIDGIPFSVIDFYIRKLFNLEDYLVSQKREIKNYLEEITAQFINPTSKKDIRALTKFAADYNLPKLQTTITIQTGWHHFKTNNFIQAIQQFHHLQSTKHLSALAMKLLGLYQVEENKQWIHVLDQIDENVFKTCEEMIFLKDTVLQDNLLQHILTCGNHKDLEILQESFLKMFQTINIRLQFYFGQLKRLLGIQTLLLSKEDAEFKAEFLTDLLLVVSDLKDNIEITKLGEKKKCILKQLEKLFDYLDIQLNRALI